MIYSPEPNKTLTQIITVLIQNILPIFVVAGFGFALQRWQKLDKRVLARVVLNVFSPALVFSSLVSSRLPGDELLRLAGFALLNMTAMGLVALAAARLLRLSRSQTMAFLIVLMFVNGGNYGLTLNQLRYGSDGLARAVVYYTVSTLTVYTLGLFIASMGTLSWQDSLKRVAKFPAVYAAVAAVVVYSFDLTLPRPLLRSIEVAGAGAIPVMLVVLGMQLADLRQMTDWRLALPAVSLRLLVGPLVALGVASLLGLQGLGRSTSIIEASMPTAVLAIVLATEFDLQPTAVTSIVVLSTLLSPFTVAGTITILGL
ncbi:MAG: AEC family transporter [Anaerolineae bacterium]